MENKCQDLIDAILAHHDSVDLFGGYRPSCFLLDSYLIVWERDSSEHSQKHGSPTVYDWDKLVRDWVNQPELCLLEDFMHEYQVEVEQFLG